MCGFFLFVGWKGKVYILFLVIIVRKCRGDLVLFSGLRLAAIAFLPERKVEIVAIEAHPISLSALS